MARILYLASSPGQYGPNIMGGLLVRRLSEHHDVRVVALAVPTDSPLLANHYAEHVVAESHLHDYDAIVMEGGWNWEPDPAQARLSQDRATEFVRNGGVLIVCDVDRNTTGKKLDAVNAAAALLRATPKQRDGCVYYLLDDLGRDSETNGFWFAPTEMSVDDWLQPAFDGVDSLLAELPVYIMPGDGIAASGTTSTDVLFADIFEDRAVRAPWASASAVGNGHSVVIGASVTHDSIVDRAPGNAVWINNLVAMLATRSAERVGWSQPLDPRVATADLLKQDESQQLERKSSFLASLDVSRPDVPQKTIQHSVGKSVAALANTDGGYLIIGQADDKTVLGLKHDFKLLGKKRDPRDAFEQSLAAFLERALDPGWSALGITYRWSSDDDDAVLVLHVPRSPSIVHLSADADREVVYVRVLTTTRELKGRALTEWMVGRVAQG